MYFADRIDAGRKLGKLLAKKYNGKDCLVYALPRGGVVTGLEVAKALNAPLDLLIIRKIGHPGNPEYAIGAISEHGHLAKGPDFDSIDTKWLDSQIVKEQKEIKRRRILYLQDRKEKDPKGKIAIIVDDGIATGLTIKAAILELQEKSPAKIIIAVPVAPEDVLNNLKKEVDDIVCLAKEAEYLGSVGSYYEDFPQISDDEVIKLLAKSKDPIVFAFPNVVKHAEKIIQAVKNGHRGLFEINRFPNKELQITLKTPVIKKDVIVYANPVSELEIMELLLLCDTIKKEEADSITVILPYFPYSRQDMNEKMKSQGFIWFGDMLRSSGVDRILTIDVHNSSLVDYFPVALVSLSPAELFAEKIKAIGFDDVTFVAPDEGAKVRCQEVATLFGLKANVTFCRKKRIGKKIISVIIGDISEKAFIIDDMLDTGGTLIACCKDLVEKGVTDIHIFVTHGFFTGSAWKKLWEYPVKHIYCTDTVPVFLKDKRISTVSADQLLIHAITELYV